MTEDIKTLKLLNEDNSDDKNFYGKYSNSNIKTSIISSGKISEQIFLEWSDINYYIKQSAPQKDNKVDDFFKINPNPISEKLNNDDLEIDDPTKRHILRNQSGFALPNEILAILGPSGSGKTSLLNVIADRQIPTGSEHIITRNIKANSIELSQDNFGQICAYIMQEDILLSCLTVRESLLFGARLKLRTSREDCEKRVSDLIQQV